ncbi:prepilin peptidase [Stieleria sp. JC731]|uniref:A24 family peptidase n=1 Tax=Pirellulaceae TaxID=2691357 RepID=UPI001E2A3D98|nr:prepilin peptidase [Stieleria sp. JC731]MCC9600577.1 prepilin peptidase [Stieleria sp. JC731]
MTRHRLRKRIPLLITLMAIGLCVAGYVLGLAYVQAQIYDFYEFEDLVGPRLIDAVIASWLIYFCSSIGSFLNVVAWRMPRGEGIGGRSHCPRCNATLCKRDNVPILGWISLTGRCRTCSLPISRRYPIVEALVGITLTIVGIAELYSLALPAQFVHGHGGPLWAPQVGPILITILSYHAVVLSTLWAMTLIRIDGVRLPRKLLGFAAVAIIVPILVYPMLMVVPWQTQRPTHWVPSGLYYDALMRVITATVAAAFVGRVLAKGLCPTADLKLDPLGKGTARLVDLIAMLTIAAVAVGWQSFPALVVVAGVLTVLLKPLLRTIPINDGPKGQIQSRGMMEAFAFALPFALTLHLAFWRVLWNFEYWPSDQSERGVIIAWSLAVLALPIFLREPKADIAETAAAPIDLDDDDSEDDDSEDEDNGEPSADPATQPATEQATEQATEPPLVDPNR